MSVACSTQYCTIMQEDLEQNVNETENVSSQVEVTEETTFAGDSPTLPSEVEAAVSCISAS